MKLVKGFSLIEVILAMAISIGLTAILFQSLSQSNVVLQRIITFSGLERKVTVLEQLLDREISGITIPNLVWDESKQNKDDESNGVSKDGEKKDADKKNKDESSEKKDAQKENNIPQSFVYEADEAGNLKTFTFITTNPAAVYSEPQTRLVRIRYTFVPDPETPGTFIVMHQQSENLDPKVFATDSNEGIRSYPLINGVKKLTCEFLIEKSEEKSKDADKKESKKDAKDLKKDTKEVHKKIRKLQVLKEWKEEEKKESDVKKDGKDTSEKTKKQEDQKRPDLPIFIHMDITLVDDVKKVHSYQFWYAPLYDIAKGIGSKSTGITKQQDMQSSQMAFNDHQELLQDASGAVK